MATLQVGKGREAGREGGREGGEAGDLCFLIFSLKNARAILMMSNVMSPFPPSLPPPQAYLNDAATASSPSLQSMAATIYLKEGQVKEALRAVHRGATLEQ
jgi:hypothetical protein